MKKEVVFQPARWMVHVSVTSPEPGSRCLFLGMNAGIGITPPRCCRKIRNWRKTSRSSCPASAAEGYELSEAALVLPSYAEAVADGTVNADEEAYWRTGIARTNRWTKPKPGGGGGSCPAPAVKQAGIYR